MSVMEKRMITFARSAAALVACLSVTVAAAAQVVDSVGITVRDLDRAVAFYTEHFGFQTKRTVPPHFAMLSRGNLELILSTPFGPGGAAKPMLDGRKAEPGPPEPHHE